MAVTGHRSDNLAPALIGYACGLGAPDTRCADGPAALRAAGLAGRIGADRFDDVVPMADDGAAVADRIAAACRQLASHVSAQVAAGRRFAVIGGDHTSAIGTWSGLANAVAGTDRPGLIWIDAHMDAHTPGTTPSGQWHGMPLAVLLGHGDARLTGLARPGPAVDAGRVCLVGTRSFEWQEPLLLARLGVRVFAMEEVRARGLAAVMDEAISHAGSGGLPFGLSFDIDALDPADAPGTGLHVPDGLAAGELVATLHDVGGMDNFAGCEIVEYNPANDTDGRTAAIVGEALAALLGTG